LKWPNVWKISLLLEIIQKYKFELLRPLTIKIAAVCKLGAQTGPQSSIFVTKAVDYQQLVNYSTSY
jgi:hypothetical protein